MTSVLSAHKVLCFVVLPACAFIAVHALALYGHPESGRHQHPDTGPNDDQGGPNDDQGGPNTDDNSEEMRDAREKRIIAERIDLARRLGMSTDPVPTLDEIDIEMEEWVIAKRIDFARRLGMPIDPVPTLDEIDIEIEKQEARLAHDNRVKLLKGGGTLLAYVLLLILKRKITQPVKGEA